MNGSPRAFLTANEQTSPPARSTTLGHPEGAQGEYLGKTVQVIPHITDEIKERIKKGRQRKRYRHCGDLGGTVGATSRSLPFLEAIRLSFGFDMGKGNVLYIHLTLVPYIVTAGELKEQAHPATRSRSSGRSDTAQILLCRSERMLSTELKEKDRPVLQRGKECRDQCRRRGQHLQGALRVPQGRPGRAELSNTL